MKMVPTAKRRARTDTEAGVDAGAALSANTGAVAASGHSDDA